MKKSLTSVFLSDRLATMDKTPTMAQLTGSAVNQLPALYMLEASAAHHVSEAMNVRYPPVRVVVAVLIVRIKLHHHLTAGVASTETTAIGAEIIEDGTFNMQSVITDGGQPVEGEQRIAKMVEDAEAKYDVEAAQLFFTDVVD